MSTLLVFALLQTKNDSIPIFAKIRGAAAGGIVPKSSGSVVAQQLRITHMGEPHKERRKVMEEISDMATFFGIGPNAPGEISPIERLLNAFEAHEAKEDKSVEQYKKFLGELPSPLTRFLMQLIISDEEKHRAVVHAMVATLKGSLLWSKPAGSLEGTGDLGSSTAKLRSITEEFIRLEREGVREYKTLLEESAGYYHGLFKILLDSMIRDSEKHIELLEFLRKTLKEA
jgi:hypothetical protein